MFNEILIGVISAAIPAAVPLLLAALGEMFNQRSGQFNLGAEGMMMMGAFVAYYIDLKFNAPVIGIFAALITGALFGALMGTVSIVFKAEQGISGIGLYMLGWGISGTLFRVYVGGVMPINGMGSINLPILGGISPMDLVTFALLPISIWLLFHTAWGLKVRAVGTTPRAADTLGVNVGRTRFQCAVIAGAMAGIAGAYLSVCQAKMYADNMTAGRGFIAVALVYFGRWSPLGIAGGAALFSIAGAAQRLIQVYGIDFPYELALIIPYVLVIAVLALSCAGGRKRPEPMALGKPYYREYRG